MPLRIHGCHNRSSDCFEYPQKSLLKSSHSQKILYKFPYPQKSQNRRSQTQKSPSIIPVTWNPEHPPTPTPWKCSKGRVRAILRCLWHPLKLTNTSFLLIISNDNRSSWPQSSEKVMRVNKLIAFWENASIFLQILLSISSRKGMEIKYEEFGEGMENYIYSCFNYYLILHLIKKS